MTTASPRRRKKLPYHPVHDRTAKDLLRNAQVAPVEIDDPYERGATILAMRSTRDDPLADHRARDHIDEAQYQGGRAFQRDFEAAERGPRAIDPGREAVDGGELAEPITEPQRRAARQLAKVYRELGADGTALVHDILIHNRTMRQVAISRGLQGQKWESYFGMRFGECLDTLALIYGFAMR